MSVNNLSGQKKCKASTTRSMIVGGCVFVFFDPILAVMPWMLLVEIIMLNSHVLRNYRIGDILYFFAESFRLGFFVPIGLSGVFMGWLGTQFRRGRTICCGIAAGILLAFGYALVLVWISGWDFIEAGTIMPISAIFPAIVLSWWLRRWIEKRAARDDKAQTA